MSEQNRDRSYCKIVKMPKLHEETQPAEVWFEAGVIHFRNANNPEEVLTCGVEEFEERIDALAEYINDDETCSALACGRQAARRFLYNVRELLKDAKNQLHVGLPLDVISDVERSRRPARVQSGIGDGYSSASALHGFRKTASGLIVPQ
jgi:hypothetical protein